jgi:transcription antitermination factor NusG
LYANNPSRTTAIVVGGVKMENEPNANRSSKGDRVRVSEGTFAGFEGVVDMINGNRICVLIEIAGRPKPLEIDRRQIERL